MECIVVSDKQIAMSFQIIMVLDHEYWSAGPALSLTEDMDN